MSRRTARLVGVHVCHVVQHAAESLRCLVCEKDSVRPFLTVCFGGLACIHGTPAKWTRRIRPAWPLTWDPCAVSQRPALVYLDMNVWVDMSKGIAVGDQRWQRIVERIHSLVDNGSVLIVLSASIYLELWHRRDQTSREGVGRLMRDLTGYATMAPIDSIRAREVDAFVQRHVGSDRRVQAEELVGHGVCHAFGSPFGRFRFVESIASADGLIAEGPTAEAPEEWLDLKREGPEWEWFNLVGATDWSGLTGLERTPLHRIGNSRLEREMQLRQLVTTQPWARVRLRDLIITDEIEALTEEINQACWKSGTQPHGLFLDSTQFDTPPEAMRAFVDGLPSVDTLVTLREWKHRDITHEWHQHDQADLLSLAVVVPYSDVVVTERRWSHLCSASGLSTEYKTQVVALRDLERILDELASAS